LLLTVESVEKPRTLTIFADAGCSGRIGPLPANFSG
jgi:hypothetical protein